MEPAWIVPACLLAVGVGYALVRLARRSRTVTWALVCASLVALSTRGLFRERRQGGPKSPPVDGSRPPARGPATTDGGEEPTWPLMARLRRRVVSWLR